MNEVKLTPGRVALAILMGTLAGPLYQIAKGVSTQEMMDALYWLNLLSASLTAFAGTTLGVFALIGGAIGLPILQGPEKKDGGA